MNEFSLPDNSTDSPKSGILTPGLSPEHPNGEQEQTAILNTLTSKQIDTIRYSGERGFLIGLFVWDIVFLLTALNFFFGAPGEVKVILLIYLAIIAVVVYASWRFFFWTIHGNSIRVSRDQYPEIHHCLRQACDALFIKEPPAMYVLQGDGLLQAIVAKRFSQRGFVAITSELLDHLLANGDTEQLMMIIGRQLGHIAAGHTKWRIITDVIGFTMPLLHTAYWRRCHYTADRIGLIVCGDNRSAQRGLLVLIVGKTLAAKTNIDAINTQRQEMCDSLGALILEIMSSSPFMINRITELVLFGSDLSRGRIIDEKSRVIQPLQIRYHIDLSNASIGTQVIGDGTTVRWATRDLREH